MYVLGKSRIQFTTSSILRKLCWKLGCRLRVAFYYILLETPGWSAEMGVNFFLSVVPIIWQVGTHEKESD